jgi:ribonuclease Z
MAKVIILGSSNAVPDEQHENTHLAIISRDERLLVDCVSNPVVRLPQAGIDITTLTGMILTHFHPDHVSGVPLLLMNMWLLGRREPLPIYGLAHTLDRIERLMDDYDWATWPDFFPVTFRRLPESEMHLALENDDFRVFASPVKHLVPTIGLRVEFCDNRKVLAYSCDTEPCPQVVELAAGADVLIHEAAGATPGHSSAAQAGAVAREAEVGQLYLIHYRTRGYDMAPSIDAAKAAYGGPVSLAEDFLEISF